MTSHRPASAERPLHVLLCPDQPSWAFDNIATNISRHAGAHRVSKIYMRDVLDNEHRFFEAIFLKRIDLCHVFWREDIFHLLDPGTIRRAAQRMGFDYPAMIRGINSCAFTTSVYDHLFSGADDLRRRRARFALIDGYTVSSNKLRDIYAAAPGLPPPDAVIPDGVDTDHFSPAGGGRKDKRELAIGWVGNSAWGRDARDDDVKGFHRLFRPMMKALAERGFAVKEVVADPQVSYVPFADMPALYRQLDVFVCTSAAEGTPNPVLEAMACSVPVVSTDVGIVADVFGPLQRPFIIHDETVGHFADAVATLLKDAALRRRIGRENRARALQWSWEIRTRGWWPFWSAMTKRAMNARNAMRREASFLSLAGMG